MAAHFRRYVFRLDAEHLRGGGRMDVGAVAEGLLHGLVAGDVRQQTQFNLGVVRVDEHAPRRRQKHLADFASDIGPRGDVL